MAAKLGREISLDVGEEAPKSNKKRQIRNEIPSEIVLAARARLRPRASQVTPPDSGSSQGSQGSRDGSSSSSNSYVPRKKTAAKRRLRERSHSPEIKMSTVQKKNLGNVSKIPEKIGANFSTQEDSLNILSAYLKLIKPLSEKEKLMFRREKLNREEAEFKCAKEALQKLGLEIQFNMKKLLLAKNVSVEEKEKRELAADILKVKVGSKALMQIGQKLAKQKENLRMNRVLLEEDEEKLASSSPKKSRKTAKKTITMSS